MKISINVLQYHSSALKLKICIFLSFFFTICRRNRSQQRSRKLHFGAKNQFSQNKF